MMYVHTSYHALALEQDGAENGRRDRFRSQHQIAERANPKAFFVGLPDLGIGEAAFGAHREHQFAGGSRRLEAALGHGMKTKSRRLATRVGMRPQERIGE